MRPLTTRSRVLPVIGASALLSYGGCVVVDDPAPPVSIELANTTSYIIDANFFISMTATDEAGLFVQENIYTDFSTRASRTLGPNETATFELPCDRVQSMGVRAPLFAAQIGFGGGRSDDVIFLLRDADFTCGATIRFVFFTEAEAFRVRVEYPQ